MQREFNDSANDESPDESPSSEPARMAKSAPATIFLDRDGTVNRDFGYVFDPERIELFPGVASSLAQLRVLGYSLVIVTNQSAVGRGMCETAAVEATNAELIRRLLAEHPDARIDRILYCPHHPDVRCDCRKPATGLVTGPNGGWPFDRTKSWMIGDKLSDIEFGRNLGLPVERCLLVETGSGSGELERGRTRFGAAFRNFADLPEAVGWVAGSHGDG